MADLVLGAIPRIIKTGMKIKKAVETVQQNKEECRDLAKRVEVVIYRVSTQKPTLGALTHQASIPEEEMLAKSMENALKLIKDCQQRSAWRHLLGAEDMAEKLKKAQEDITAKLVIYSNFMYGLNLNLMLEISVSVEKILHCIGAHPPLVPPHAQVAGDVNSYHSILSAGAIERSGLNSNTTMVARGNAVPYASSSRFSEFNCSKRESTFNLTSVEHISEGGHTYVLKRKIVIKVAMSCDKGRSKAMALVAALGGVDSVALDGVYRNELVVVGQHIDTVKLISVLRKGVGFADLLEVTSDGPSRSNGQLPARQRFRELSSGSSSDSEEEEDVEDEDEDEKEESDKKEEKKKEKEEEEEPPCPSSFVKGKGLQRSLGRKWPLDRMAHRRNA